MRSYGCQMYQDKQTKRYTWHNSPFGLALNSDQLEAFILLLDTFEKTQILHSAKLQDLLNFLVKQLPPDQQKIIKTQHRRPFSINLHETTDYRNSDPNTVAEVEKAIRRGQQLEFRYTSPREGKERTHRIEPRPLAFERGHTYLKGWSLNHENELLFRLDKITPGSAKMLPTSIAPIRPSSNTHQLEYWLSPIIARQGVSQHFPDQQVECHTDGSATIRATITNLELFEARRLLLSYGQNCRALSPPQLVTQLRETVTNLYQIYCTESG